MTRPVYPQPAQCAPVLIRGWWLACSGSAAFSITRTGRRCFRSFRCSRPSLALANTQLGWLGSAFMLVYAVASPFTGYLVDRFSRRLLIALGLVFWSVICALTADLEKLHPASFFRAAEGLGESFYFPASMSLLADYHGPRTRSRAMGIHQTSVYLGTAGGAVLAGFLAERQGWRSPFWVLGFVGIVYAVVPELRPGRAGPESSGRTRTRSGICSMTRIGRRPVAERESLGGQVAANRRRILRPPCFWLCSSGRISWRRLS